MFNGKLLENYIGKVWSEKHSVAEKTNIVTGLEAYKNMCMLCSSSLCLVGEHYTV